jgi:hypothetical protein
VIRQVADQDHVGAGDGALDVGRVNRSSTVVGLRREHRQHGCSRPQPPRGPDLAELRIEEPLHGVSIGAHGGREKRLLLGDDNREIAVHPDDDADVDGRRPACSDGSGTNGLLSRRRPLVSLREFDQEVCAMAGTESAPDLAPYADPEPLPELIEEARSAEADLEAHGIDLHPAHHDDPTHKAPPLVVTEEASHLADGMSDYGG